MNRAFFPTPKSPSFCSLHVKASATLFPFHSACRLREGDAVPRLPSKHKICTNDASHCFGVRLVLALADGQAGSQIWLAYLVCPMQTAWEGVPACCPGFHLIQKAGTECPNIHAHKYVITEMLDCV